MLIHKNGIPVRINHHETCRPGCIPILFSDNLNTLLLQLALEFADIGKRIKTFRIAVPAGIKGQYILVEHFLKKADHTITIPENEPVLCDVAPKLLESQFFVKRFGRMYIFNCQAYRKCTELHNKLLVGNQ